MKGTHKTLSYSEQVAYDALFKLVKLGMLPNGVPDAVDFGRVMDGPRYSGPGFRFISKTRRMIFEWPKSDSEKIILELCLDSRLEADIFGNGSKQSVEKDKLWFISLIRISKSFKQPIDQSIPSVVIFFMDGGPEGKNIKFLLSPEYRQTAMS